MKYQYIKIYAFTFFTGLLLTVTPFSSQATEKSKITTPNETVVANSITRLHEIERMDKSKLTKAERKSLRKEVRDIRQDVKHTGGGVYISAGALLIVILLLILL